METLEFSSMFAGHYPKLAIDGYTDSSSAWLSANTSGAHDLEIHFPRSEKIGGIHLYSGYEGQAGTQIENFEIAYDSNGSWVVFNGGSPLSSHSQSRYQQLPYSEYRNRRMFRS